MKEVEFRDGMRTVPDHVGAMVAGLATHTMTYREAIKLAENQMIGDKLYQAQQSLIREHFKETP